MIPVGQYRRVSEDKTLSGKESSWREVAEQVTIQDKANHQLADELGVTITRDYCDNDTPASNPFIIRKDFEAMLLDLEAGIIRGILFLHADRAARLVYDAARLCRIFEMHPDYIGRSVEGSVDLSTVEGRGMFIMQATVGNMEIGNTRRRVTRTNKSMAEKGVIGGAPRPFGWQKDRKSLEPDEAELLRASILAVPGGMTVGEFRRKLTEFGYVPKETKRSNTKAPRQIQHQAAEGILTNPRLAGFRAYVPQLVRRETGRLWMPDTILYHDGEPVRGDWEAPASPEEYWACVHELWRRKSGRKSGGKPHDTTAKYLCSGICRCGKCSSPMWSNPYTPGSSAHAKYGFRYACLPSQGGCGGTTRVGPPIDDLVETAYLLETRRSLGEAVQPAEIDITVHDQRLSEIAREIAETNARRKDRRISVSAALDLIEDLEAERDQLNIKIGKLTLQKSRNALVSPDALADWENLSMTEKRTRLKQSIRAVIVHPAGRGKRFDPDLIEIVWQ